MTLENRMKKWKNSLYNHQHLEEGAIAELEDHLRENISILMEKGLDEKDAFEQSVKNLGNLPEIADEEQSAQYSKPTFVTALLKSFLKVGTRQFRRNRLTSGINMLGLTTAFCASLFIGLFVYDELSFEKRHPDWDKIYRLSYSFIEQNGKIEDRAFSSGMWVDQLAPRNPAIIDRFRFLMLSYGYINNPLNEDSYYTEGVYWSDPNFFDFLNFELKFGEPEAQLNDLSSIILTETTAKKHFGNENPIGKQLKFVRRSRELNLTVTGVIFDPPSNSHFQPEYVAHLQALQGILGEERRGWVDRNPAPGYLYTYIKVNSPEAIPVISADMKSIWEEVIPDQAEQITPLLTPLSDIHFQPPMRWEIDSPIDMSYLYGLMVIGVFILTIALTNYINLTTALGGKRQKEIGLRKTLGSTKSQLRWQFFIESSLSIVISMIVATAICYFLMPGFNELTGKNINLLISFESAEFITVFAVTTMFIILTSGFWSSMYFTKRIKNNFNMNAFFKRENANSKARNIMVVLQFTVAICLIIGTIIVYNQLQLINNGFLAKSRNAVIGIRTSLMGDSLQIQRYKTEIQSISGVIGNTHGMHLPRQSDFGRTDTRYLATEISDQEYYWNKFDADGGFVQTFDLKLIAGEDFKRRIDPGSVIVNETVVRELGVTPDEAIGVFLREDSINYVYEAAHGKIIGVVEDFAYKSIKEAIEPVVIVANNSVWGVLSVKLETDDTQMILASLREKWREIYPGRPFEYWFLDKEFERLYNQERRLGRLIPIFSGLAIVIALLGLFALTVFISELRKKEMGIRKVLGCSTREILRLLTWQYLRTLIPAIIIALPLSYIGLDYWLNNFAYRVNVNIGVMLLAVFSVVIVALLTVSIKSLSAVKKNPVESLKYE
ncbi:MAG: FtsX-like permease family protein [Cyclobacteriaceae bacterium]